MKKLVASLLTVATVASMASISTFAAVTGSVDVTLTADDSSIFVDDKNYGDKKEITPDSTIYIDLSNVGTFTMPTEDKGNTVKTGAALHTLLVDDDMFKVKTDKGDDDSKIIKKISVVEKDVDSKETGANPGRENVIKIELKDDMTDDEFKINPSVTFTAKYNMDANGNEVKAENAVIADGTKYTVELGNFYVSNEEVPGDKDWKAGDNGVVAKPEKNDDNEVTWEDENDTIVKLTFEGDDDAAKYYPKMSTQWNEADYAENFADTDAFIRSFVGNPTIPATSRPVLEFYSPFVDDDDEFTVAPEDVVIYEVVDGVLKDVTDKFTIAENDDDDTVFMLKTRTLGTYIFSNGPAVAPAEEIEEPIEEVPAEDTDKENPGTGRF